MEPKAIIVEGKTDKEKLLRVLDEAVHIVCTYGTFSLAKIQRLAEEISDEAELYIFTDQDESGQKLRKQLRNEFPDAVHLYTRKEYAQVANTPDEVLAEILYRAGFAVRWQT